MSTQILLVEDTSEALDNLKDLLSLEGFEVVTASNGQDAFDKLYLYRPDLIITDLRMPKMDGFELISKLKATERYRDIPVIVFSANTTPQFQEQAIASGAAFFLKKPSPTDLILSTIHDVINRT
jgi:CheY-like chemotaxis protein